MRGWDYFFLIVIVLQAIGVFVVEPKQVSQRMFNAFGDSAPSAVAFFGSGLCLVLDEAVVGHSFWLYVAGGLMMVLVLIAVMSAEHRLSDNHA
jgi:hypothetical protein